MVMIRVLITTRAVQFVVPATSQIIGWYNQSLLVKHYSFIYFVHYNITIFVLTQIIWLWSCYNPLNPLVGVVTLDKPK